MQDFPGNSAVSLDDEQPLIPAERLAYKRQARTVSVKRMTKTEIERGNAQLRHDLLGIEHVTMPVSFAECESGANQVRPCPFVRCKHHLYLDVNQDSGSIKYNFPDLQPHELSETCSLDVANRGESTLEEIGDLMGLTRERVRQIEKKFLAQLKHENPHLREMIDKGITKNIEPEGPFLGPSHQEMARVSELTLRGGERRQWQVQILRAHEIAKKRRGSVQKPNPVVERQLVEVAQQQRAESKALLDYYAKTMEPAAAMQAAAKRASVTVQAFELALRGECSATQGMLIYRALLRVTGVPGTSYDPHPLIPVKAPPRRVLPGAEPSPNGSFATAATEDDRSKTTRSIPQFELTPAEKPWVQWAATKLRRSLDAVLSIDDVQWIYHAARNFGKTELAERSRDALMAFHGHTYQQR